MKRHANIAIFVPHAGCEHRCVFCNQRGISGASGIPDSDVIADTLRRAAENLGERKRQAEIAFFGGSFTAIPHVEMVRLLEAAQPFLGPRGFSGIRISTRPDAVPDSTLQLLRQFGVKAIELGAQSMDDRVLEACGRGHTAEDVRQAARRIHAHNFELGLQMMTGLPLDTDCRSMKTAEALAELQPESVRIYPALVLRGTSLADWWREGTYRPQQLEEAVSLGARLLDFFTGRGIRVIKLGLHDGEELRNQFLAGPYHPAFRELCEAQVLLQRALKQLDRIPPGNIQLTVAPGSASKMAGQRRSNLLKLQHAGYRASIRESSSLHYLQVEVSIQQ